MPTKKKDAKQGPTVLRLLADIETFLTVNEMDNDGNSFGWLAVEDGNIVTRLRDGGDLTTSKMDEIYRFMQNPVEHWLNRNTSTRGVERIQALKPLTKGALP